MPRLAKGLTFLIAFLIIMQQFSTVFAAKPPYKEGDWFIYEATAKMGAASGKVRAKITVTDIDLLKGIVKARTEILDLDREANELLQTHLGLSAVTEYDLDDEPEDGSIFINPKYSGTYKCSVPGAQECTVKYRQGVLTYAKIVARLYVSFETTIRLVDSSVLLFSPIRTALIIIGTVVAVVVIVVVILIYVKKKPGVKQQPVQQIPPPTPPPSPAPPVPQS